MRDDNMKMKRIQLLVIALAILMALTACSTKQSDNSNSKSETKEAQQESKISDTNKKLAKLYNQVLDNVDSYTFFECDDDIKFSYRYALVKLNHLDFPLLLVSADSDSDGMSYIKAFYPKDDTIKEILSSDLENVGVASAGGFRGSISQNANHDNLIFSALMSGTGDSSTEEIKPIIKNNELVIEKNVIWEGRFDQQPDLNITESDIIYSDISDRRMIEDLASKKD